MLCSTANWMPCYDALPHITNFFFLVSLLTDQSFFTLHS